MSYHQIFRQESSFKTCFHYFKERVAFSRRSLKDRLYFLHLTSYFFCDSPNRIKFPTLALTDIRGEPREAVEELGSDGREGTGPQETGRYGFAEDV